MVRNGVVFALLLVLSAGQLPACAVPLYDTTTGANLSARSVNDAIGSAKYAVGAKRVPDSLTAFLKQAARAVNTHTLANMAPFVAGKAAQTVAWVTETTTKTWQEDVLLLPVAPDVSAPADYLAVFHAWHSCESDGDHVHHVVNTPQGWRLGPEIPETETGGFRVRDHAATVKLDIGRQRADIADEVQIERTTEPTPAYFLLRLSQDFRVRAMTIARQETVFQQAGGVLLVAPPANKNFTLALHYDGSVHHAVSDYILTDEATLNSYWLPHIARLPATATLTAVAPKGWTALAPGEPGITAHNADGSTTTTFRNDVPVSVYTLDVGRYVVTSRERNGLTLSAYLLSHDTNAANYYLNILERALPFYQQRFGAFPYKRYAVVETRGPLDGALEAYSFATFGARTLIDEIPHELSHSWWGGRVPCTYLHSMWNEAFATYSETLFARENSSGQTPAQRPDYGARFDRTALEQARDTSDTAQVAVGYDKGGLVLRQLEEEIGQEKLLASMRAFVAAVPRGEAAEWRDFARAVNATTGQNYDWFFQQWLERTGLPTLRVSPLTVTPQSNGGFVVEGDIAQDGTPYRLTLPYRLGTEGAGKPTEGHIVVQGARTHFRLEADAPARPTRLVLDPGFAFPVKIVGN